MKRARDRKADNLHAARLAVIMSPNFMGRTIVHFAATRGTPPFESKNGHVGPTPRGIGREWR